jgi:hypothetical protein
MRSIFLCVVAAIVALPVAAEQVTSREARKALFAGDKISVQVFSHLSKKDQATMKALVPLMAQQMRTPARYYGAIAYAEEDGLASESLQGAFNFHSIASADAAAIKACQAASKTKGARCRLAARILPGGYDEQSFSLSQQASEAALGQFRRLSTPRVFARSKARGAWGMGQQVGPVIASCNAGTDGLNDCEVVIMDE